MHDNIILIGMPGSGKSTLGVVVAKYLGLDFVDCDIVIQRERGETLASLIDRLGVDGFLDVEGDALSRLSPAHPSVIATGGSAEAAAKLVEKLGGQVVRMVFVMELAGLEGRKKLDGYDVESLIVYPGK